MLPRELNFDAFLTAFKEKGFRRVDVLAMAMQDITSFNRKIFPYYSSDRHNIGLRNALVEVNMPFAKYMALRFSKYPNISYDEYLSEALSALLNAVERYDITRGFYFSTYAGKCIEHSFYDLMSRNRVVHIPQYLFKYLSNEELARKNISERRLRSARAGLIQVSLDKPVNKDRLRRSIGHTNWENLRVHRERSLSEYFASVELDPSTIAMRKEFEDLIQGFLKNEMFVRECFGVEVTKKRRKEFAQELGITSQAVSERLKRRLSFLCDDLCALEHIGEGLFEYREPRHIIVYQDYKELRKYARMLRSIGDYPAFYASEEQELEQMCEYKDPSLCIADIGLFENLNHAVCTIRKKRKALPTILTFKEPIDEACELDKVVF